VRRKIVVNIIIFLEILNLVLIKNKATNKINIIDLIDDNNPIGINVNTNIYNITYDSYNL